MFGIHDLWLFVLSGLLLNITPGPDTLYIVGRSSTQGCACGAVAALGIGTGALVHICAAAVGLSAILAASATAFTAVKFVGAAYLMYVGISLIRSKSSTPIASRLRRATPPAGHLLPGLSHQCLESQGRAVFPGISAAIRAADAPSKPVAFLLLGAIFDFNGTLWNLFIAWSTARISRRIAAADQFKRWFNRCVGGLLVFVGIRLALTLRCAAANGP